MVQNLTFNIANSNGRTFSMLAQDESLVRVVVNVKDNIITQNDIKTLQNLAAKNGDAGVLEQCDLSGHQKLNLAKLNGFEDYYDMKLSEDGKMFQVTVKRTGMFTKNPTLATIKSDFGIEDNVLVQKGKIPYGNEDLINERAKAGSSADGRSTDYNAAVLKPGDTINLPVACLTIDSSPRGFFRRFMMQ